MPVDNSKIRMAREAAGLSLQDLADILASDGGEPIPVAILGRIERDQQATTYGNKERIAKALGVSTAALL